MLKLRLLVEFSEFNTVFRTEFKIFPTKSRNRFVKFLKLLCAALVCRTEGQRVQEIRQEQSVPSGLQRYSRTFPFLHTPPHCRDTDDERIRLERR